MFRPTDRRTISQLFPAPFPNAPPAAAVFRPSRNTRRRRHYESCANTAGSRRINGVQFIIRTKDRVVWLTLGYFPFFSKFPPMDVAVPSGGGYSVWTRAYPQRARGMKVLLDENVPVQIRCGQESSITAEFDWPPHRHCGIVDKSSPDAREATFR